MYIFHIYRAAPPPAGGPGAPGAPSGPTPAPTNKRLQQTQAQVDEVGWLAAGLEKIFISLQSGQNVPPEWQVFIFFPSKSQNFLRRSFFLYIFKMIFIFFPSKSQNFLGRSFFSRFVPAVV